jgi:hypothetical protein
MASSTIRETITERRRETMNDQSLAITFTVDQTPEQAFAAINNVRGWWSGNIEGNTDKLGDEWAYRYKDIHYSKQRITELIPGKKVVWLVEDGYLNFVEDKTEWKAQKLLLKSQIRARKQKSASLTWVWSPNMNASMPVQTHGALISKVVYGT